MEIKLERKKDNQAVYVNTEIKIDEKGKKYFEVNTVRPVCFKKREYLGCFRTAEAYIEWLKTQKFKVVK
jgi:hypothetical protein